MWSMGTKGARHVLRGHDHVVECVEWAPTGALPLVGANGDAAAVIVSGSRDKTIRFWDAAAGVPLFTLIGHDNWVCNILLEFWHIVSAKGVIAY